MRKFFITLAAMFMLSGVAMAHPGHHHPPPPPPQHRNVHVEIHPDHCGCNSVHFLYGPPRPPVRYIWIGGHWEGPRCHRHWISGHWEVRPAPPVRPPPPPPHHRY